MQTVWVQLLLQSPVHGAPAGLVVQAYWLWWLSLPACAAVSLFVGYRLVVRDYADPRLDFALVYFSFGILVLLGISVLLMINR
jgi:hypothetical protein